MTFNIFKWAFRVFCVLALLVGTLSVAAPLSAEFDRESAIGQSTQFLQEQDGQRTLADVVVAYRSGAFKPGTRAEAAEAALAEFEQSEWGIKLPHVAAS